jgi:uncharacterized protein
VARIAIRVQPRASRNEVVGERDGVVLIRVAAPAEEGRANEAVRKLLAKRARVPRAAVTLVRGERSRDKVVEVADVDDAYLRAALGLESR